VSIGQTQGVNLVKSALSRAVHPGHLWRAAQLQRHRKRDSRSHDDVQLKLYSEMLPSDFLHYGYFDDVNRAPEDISLNEIVVAQNRYADLILDQVVDKESEILDVGCGMGGLCRMMLARGLKPVELTPDRLQVSHVSQKFPGIEVIKSKFEKLPAADYAHRFGTVITAESLQYLKLDQALPHLDQILKPGGRWIACDYFYRQPTHEKSCHEWNHFNDKITAAGWRITHQQEITRNVAPTLRYIHMWATRFGIPLMQFAFVKFRKKQPALHYVFQNVLTMLQGLADHNLPTIDPVAFAEKHRYMLLVMER
jgi:MPBQ/MSBQ methyltransferase